jgi:hypothetical protein
MPGRIYLITGGDSAGHPFGETAPLTENILRDGGFEVTREENLNRVKQPGGLADFDAVVLHGRFPDRDDQAERSFESFVHGGKGLTVVHIASNSFECSARWRKLVGRVWEYGGPPPFTSSHPEPPGPFQVNIVDTAHPITTGLQDFDLIQDERYQDLLVAPNARAHDLATATLEGRTEPVAWVLTPPQGGRVFHITLGHNHTTYENKGFQMLLNHGVAWTAGVPI